MCPGFGEGGEWDEARGARESEERAEPSTHHDSLTPHRLNIYREQHELAWEIAENQWNWLSELLAEEAYVPAGWDRDYVGWVGSS